MPKINNLFIVDNCEVMLKTTSLKFKDQDFKVHTYSNPEEALNAMETTLPEIILLDYFMPEMTGAEFMVKVSERLLQNPNWQVYLITSKDFDEEEQVSMLTLGITKVFKKPVNQEALLAAIEMYQAE